MELNTAAFPTYSRSDPQSTEAGTSQFNSSFFLNVTLGFLPKPNVCLRHLLNTVHTSKNHQLSPHPLLSSTKRRRKPSIPQTTSSLPFCKLISDLQTLGMEGAMVADFPKFPDGDVLILLGAVKQYHLHSAILRRHSPYFAYLLDLEGPAKLTTATRHRPFAVLYCFELIRPADPKNGVGHFERKGVDKNGRYTLGGLLPDNENGKVVNEQIQYWDWLFGTFYGKSPSFDDSNLATTLSGCMGLVDVAETIHAVDLVRPLVDLALLRQGSVLWASIASNPIAWAELGRRVHSPTVFTEGVIHVVGKWNNLTEDDKKELHPDIRALCQRKFREIDIAKEAIEMRILGHYPDFLCRNAVDRPGRPTYSNDIYMWMAIAFFRQWFAQAISDGRNRTNPDGGYEFYSAIGSGGQAYLNHESFKNFHQYFPMSSKACNVLEANMNVMKEDVKKFVKDLLENRSNVNKTNYPQLNWLTCCLITKEDYPWHVVEGEEEEPQTTSPNDDSIRGL